MEKRKNDWRNDPNVTRTLLAIAVFIVLVFALDGAWWLMFAFWPLFFGYGNRCGWWGHEAHAEAVPVEKAKRNDDPNYI